MPDLLTHLFEHNDWANAQLLAACAALPVEKLDATPDELTPWSLRRVLCHLGSAQQGYVNLLTLPVAERSRVELAFDELADSLPATGARLLELARAHDAAAAPGERICTDDGYAFERWIVLVQVINHATDHRRQATRMMRALGLTPPRIDAWSHGMALGEMTGPDLE